jgi:hypothetical protein
MDRDTHLRELLGRVFDGARGSLRADLPADEYERRKLDFVFHMTDWSNDLARLADCAEHPDRLDDEAASRLVIGFLYHVVPHLNAAGRLLLDEITDPFADQPEQHLAPNAGGAG